MSEIVDILMRRDGIGRNEATNMVDECVQALEDELNYGGTLEDCEYIVADYLGLEPDYLIILLNEISE